MCPCPVVSSAKRMPPAPICRFEPSPHSISTRPLSVTTNCRRGALWKSSSPPTGVSRKITPSAACSADSRP